MDRTTTMTWQATDGAVYDMGALMEALRDIKGECPYPILTTIDAPSKRPVSRAVSACAFCPSDTGFERVRVRVRKGTRKLAHIADDDWGSVCLAFTSAPHKACFTLTGRATCADEQEVPIHEEQRQMSEGTDAGTSGQGARFAFMEIDVDTIELVSHGHALARDSTGRQPIVLRRTVISS